MTKQEVIRLKYSITCKSYDELYIGEQFEKYACTFKTGYHPFGVVLDVGGGTGLLIEYLYRNYQQSSTPINNILYYICLDLTPCMISICRSRVRKYTLDHLVEFVEADAEHLPLRSKSVDVAYSFTVLDLLEKPERGYSEVVRVCRVYTVISSLKKANNTFTRLRAVSYGRKLCETSKDIIFVSRCAEGAESSAG